MDREIADVVRKRAEELAETGKGISHFSGAPVETGHRAVNEAGDKSKEVIRKEIEAQCENCYQKYTLPPGTKVFTCEVCGHVNKL